MDSLLRQRTNLGGFQQPALALEHRDEGIEQPKDPTVRMQW